MIRRRAALAVTAGWALSLAGCPPPCPPRHVPLSVLAAEYNANAARVDRLWARAKVRLTLRGESGLSFSWGSTSPLAPPNAQLRLWKEGGGPANFVLVGREIAELFRVGIDAGNGLYYVWYRMGDGGQAWVGRTALAGAPGVRDVPIDPLQLVEVLGVTALPVQPGKLPTVVMTLEDDPCAYVVRYLKPQPVSGKLKVWREVWFRWDGRRPRRPYRVRLFDPAGRCRVTADVAGYKPIEWDGPETDAPVMATDFRLRWLPIPSVQGAAKMHVTISGMSTTRPFKKAFFDFPSHLPAGVSPAQVDAAYGRADNKHKSP